ncbi:glycosyltransferase family 2 protein [Nesterenkonia alba]|uniref:glycosyltransferase family 2 protein n=1 Tax=Nesterenkonia alba TaxID=515814 RepID=UPI0003B5DA52|nr:glycosyltransferase family 2 protein [Nesterenkonia alba]
MSSQNTSSQNPGAAAGLASLTDPAAARRAARIAVESGNLQLAVIIPVFNNGEHLRARAFPSLTASEHFSRLHVLLIDDGSTYPETLTAVEELAAAYDNVTAFRHPPGGSGSASRARNTGLELTFTEHVTWLDPDDEFLGDGPWDLHRALAAAPEAQLAIGNQRRVFSTAQEHVDNLRYYCHHRLAPGRFAAGADVLTRAQFRPANLSATAARTQWLKSLGVRQVPGAAGQDSLFFLQAFAAAESFAAVGSTVYAYHAEVSGSMVNTVTAEYFRKCLVREQAQAAWLAEEGLLERYVSAGFERAFSWYLGQLRRTPKDQRAEASRRLHEIAALYVDPARHPWRYPEAMAFFRRPGVPSVEGLKPLAGRLRSSARRLRQAARPSGPITPVRILRSRDR